MFVALFLISLALALVIAVTVAWAAKGPVEGILRHFFSLSISVAISKYISLAIVVAGVSAGARIRSLEEYVNAPAWSKAEMTASLTQEFWAVELYRTAIGTIEGILWLLLLLAVIGFVAVLIIRKTRLKLASAGNEKGVREPEKHVTMMR